MLDLVERVLTARGIGFGRLDGSMPQKARSAAINAFQVGCLNQSRFASGKLYLRLHLLTNTHSSSFFLPVTHSSFLFSFPFLSFPFLSLPGPDVQGGSVSHFAVRGRRRHQPDGGQRRHSSRSALEPGATAGT
jgi:hypothetical protein